MDYSNIIIILLLAFSVGMVHALDADHVIAVSSLACHKKTIRDGIRFCLNWTIGHSLTLLVIGVAVFVFGMTIPQSMSAWAEGFVGLLLILIGVGVLLDLRKNSMQLHFHRHDEGVVHAHWHSREHSTKEHDAKEQNHHRAVLVGVLHGAAGSAPLLAVIPLTVVSSPWLGMLYLLIFSTGIFIAMLFVGGIIGSVFTRLHHGADRVLKILLTSLGSVSIIFGGMLIKSVVTG